MFNYTLEDIEKAREIYCKLENRLENLAKEFGMTYINEKKYVLDSYSFDFFKDEEGCSLTDIYVSSIDNKKDVLSFPFPTSWIWDKPDTHKNAYIEWINKCPKIMYRPHRGTYEESMREVKWFHTEEEMFDYIVNNSGFITSNSSLFVGDEIIYDERNTWNTRYVYCNSYAGKKLENPICIGMCNIKGKYSY